MKFRYLIGYFLTLVAVLSMAKVSSAKELSIAIIDSGGAKYVDSALSFTNVDASRDWLNHGNIVAGIIRKKNLHAKLTMLQVCEKFNHELRPSTDAVIKALTWAIENRVDIINMSLVLEYNQTIDQLITEAYQDHNIIIIAASGNFGLTHHFTVNPQGYMVKSDTVIKPAFPSSNPHVISVGALNTRGDRADYSAYRSDLYINGKASHQDGSSFACAKISALTGKILHSLHNVSKDSIIASLKNG